ncbi:hypothetical protein O0L34_g11519 [Tuta absoluta]|nr:hypothetical protein O0L34_g11519 [Tuta absoluta]
MYRLDTLDELRYLRENAQGQMDTETMDYQIKGTHHSRQAGPQFEEYLPLLGLLVEDVEPRPAFQRAEAAQVREGGEVEVFGLGHGEAPDQQVEEARVVHVYGGSGRVSGQRMSREGGVAPPPRPGGTEGRAGPPRLDPSARRPPAIACLHPSLLTPPLTPENA